jgi:hypothetical protein
MLGPSLHLPLEVAGMNIWQVLQGSVQLPKGSPAGRQLPQQQQQQQDLLQHQAATNISPVAPQVAEIRSGTAPAALQQQQQSATTASSLAVDATTMLLPVDPATAAAEEAVGAAAVETEAAADASAPVPCGSIESSSNMVSVQLHVLHGGHVRVQLVVPCALVSDPAAAAAAAAAAKQTLRVDAAAEAAAAAADRDMSPAKPTHYTPTIGKGRLRTGCWDMADVHIHTFVVQ